MKKYFILFILLFLTSITVYAQDTLEIESGGEFGFVWTPNTEPDLAGYRSYISTISGEYNFGEENAYSIYGLVSESPRHKITLPGTYFFVLTAFDTEGLESGPSNEVCLIVKETQQILSPINFRMIMDEYTIFKDTSYSEFKNQENVEYIPKE